MELTGNTWLSKQDYILNYLSKYKNKELKLLDIGCCGHIKNIDTQIRKNKWLHGRFDSLATVNIGVDINEEACNYLINNYGRNDVIYADITKDMDRVRANVTGGVFDYVILADIIEHTEEPIGFLKSISKSKIAKNIIVTVPNAMHIVNSYFSVFQSAEVINNDHHFWFSSFTLMKCCNAAGIEIEEIDVCDYKIKGKLVPKIFRKKILGATVFLAGRL